jgi:isoleucyl-tRNA synthetase
MSDTNIPKTPKTIAEKEIETLAFWQDNKIFEKSVDSPASKEPKGSFSFYDGPPFATGLPHYGHILAGTIKDTIPRYQTMKGNTVRRKWGWDCHGLPIENLIEKKLGLASKKDIEEYGIDKFNKDAHQSVLIYEAEWQDIVPRLGRFVDMKHDYKTMDATYTESIWWAWKTLYEKGLAYEGNKMMHICPRCETPLAQSEVGLEYTDVTDLSVTAKFELVDEPGTYVLAWTTTPWTLPGNTALAVNKDLWYAKISIKDELGERYYIAAWDLLNKIFEVELRDENGNFLPQITSLEGSKKEYNLVARFKGEDIIGKSYKPVFPYFIDKDIENKENIWKIWHADFITDDAGTGIAHEAPAFGADDMELAKANNIPIIKHVKMDGTFIDAVTDFAGVKVKKAGDTQSADIEIIKWLAHNGKLFEKHKIIHSYPLCWRCKTPLLNYATSSWFFDVPQIKDIILSENKNIGWVPAHIRDGRFGKWKEGEHEWAVSRTRYWGAPLPVWKSTDGKVVVLGSLQELAEKNKQKIKNTYYVMRHGEAKSNVEGVLDCSGDKENHLTEVGKGQVAAAIDELLDKKIDIIVTSPFVRTMETTDIIANKLQGVEVIVDKRLQEFNLGIFDKKPISFLHEQGRRTLLDLDEKISEGETHREEMSRVMSLWNELEQKYEGKNILMVTHGSPGWMLVVGTIAMTDSAIHQQMADKLAEHWLPNAKVIALSPLALPRDETGSINLHRPYIDAIELEIEGETYKRIPDVFDCWFESGSMPFASLHYPFENKDIFDKNYPADFIAEGLDQTRGWFSSLMNLGVGLFGKAPYKHVIVNGLVLASSGLKLSKREGNYTDPMLLVGKYGADAMRYALLSSPVVKGESIQFSDDHVSDVYKKLIMRLENVVSLYEMNRVEEIVPNASSTEILDRWILSRLHEVVRDATKGLDEYKLDEAFRPFDLFIDDLSVWYIRRSRERLKGDTGVDDQKLALETLTYVLQTFAKIAAPVMPFIAERVYKQSGGEKESVHLESWPLAGDIDNTLVQDMKSVREVVSLALMIRTKEGISVRQPLAALSTSILIDSKYYPLILDEVNIKQMHTNKDLGEVINVDTALTDELIREGNIRHLMRSVQDTRKEMKLSPKDTVSITVCSQQDLGDLGILMSTCNVEEVIKSNEPQSNKVTLSFGDISFTLQA